MSKNPKANIQDKYLVALAAFSYFGPARIRLLIPYFGSIKKLWLAPVKNLIEVGIPERIINEFDRFRNSFDIDSYFEKLKRLGIKITTFLDFDFPKSIKNLDGAPVVLYYKGTLKSLKKNSVSIVGSRRMTPYGFKVTQKFSSELASFGVTIISGLARGIDTTAHESCLSVGGATIAILGNGLDRVYPPENATLANKIIKNGGAVVSEYPLGMPALPVNFAMRNRIISGLSDVVLVIEGAEKSGTLLTASHAASQGKTLFAVPGEITSPLSAAPLFLLKNGARIMTETNDILDELGIGDIKEKTTRIINK